MSIIPDNLNVVAKKKILKELKKHYADDTILAAIEELEAAEEITDEKIKKLMETIIPPLASGFWSKLRGGPLVEEKQARKERTETLLKIPNLEKLFDDPQVSANRRSGLKDQAEKSGISLSETTPNSGQDSSFLNPRAQHKEKALGTITESDLLNKPNMTPEDKQHMQDVLDFMKKENSLRTDENLKKLYDNVHYHHNAIEIGGRKWSRSYRESTKVGPNTPDYISGQGDIDKPRAFYKQETGLQYFNYEAALEEDKVMRKQGRYLPSKEDLEATLLALPGDYKEGEMYLGGNIFNLLLNGKNSYTGFCNSSGLLHYATSDSYLLSISPYNKDYYWVYVSGTMGYGSGPGGRNEAFPPRPLVQ